MNKAQHDLMEELTQQLKQQVIEALNLEEVAPTDIDNDAPLFGEGLGLDSIDALELIVLMEKEYGIKLKTPAEGKAIFKSISTMAQYINDHRTK
ncbi:MAG: acyl carrier protein [Bacteroidaceae bacterium]|nr:acyl carrier protein [Bacteroidaceae bacterium]